MNKRGHETAFKERPMDAYTSSGIFVCISLNNNRYYHKKFNFNSSRFILLNDKRIQDILQCNVM